MDDKQCRSVFGVLADGYKHCQQGLQYWLAAGWLLFVAGFFIAPKESALKIIFYTLLVLPGLLLTPYWLSHWQRYTSRLLLISIVLALYMATTLFWSGESIGDWLLFFYKQAGFISLWLMVTAWLGTQYVDRVVLFTTVFIRLAAFTALLTIGWYFYQAGLAFPRMKGLGMLKNELVAAQAYGAIAVMAYVQWLRKSPQKLFTIDALAVLLCATAVLLSQSRGPLLYMLLTLMVVAIVLKPGRGHYLNIALVFIFVGGGLWIYTPDFLASLWDRAAVSSHRLVIWKKILADSRSTLVFGQGVVRFTDFTVSTGSWQHSHNVFIDTLRFSGLVGVGLLGGHMLTAFSGWRARVEYYPYYAWLLFGCLCMLTNGKFLLSRPDWLWICYWLPVGFICAAQSSQTLLRVDSHQRKP